MAKVVMVRPMAAAKLNFSDAAKAPNVKKAIINTNPGGANAPLAPFSVAFNFAGTGLAFSLVP
ncbi:MAG: hypothetical protein DHS20C08_03700 [Rhodomicrobium sp.]|nr:MAG: hypothetical protein DHS20C08_03700 [Rhodomicrobium sp.]